MRGADKLTVVLSAASTFAGWSVAPGSDPAEALREATAVLDAVDLDKLRERHLDDHTTLYDRAELTLGSPVDLPTDERIRAVAAGGNDPDLSGLIFAFGRYLLMGSSRPGTQAANLQGIWNEDRRPMWASDWTNNINTQMNYWPADVTGLRECFDPLTDLLEGLVESGTETARILYDAPGWVSHHNADIWMATWPVGDGGDDPVWSMAATCGVWMSAHLMEHHRFHPDLDFLRDKAYPVLAGAAEFMLSMLVEDREGRLQFIPSTAPEHHFILPSGQKASVDLTTTYDKWLLRELFANVLAAEADLGLSSDLAERIRAAEVRLPGIEIAADGRMMEWPTRLAAVRTGSPAPVPPVRAVPGLGDRPGPYAGVGVRRTGVARSTDEWPAGRRVDQCVADRFVGKAFRAGEGSGRTTGLHGSAGVRQPAAS